MDNNDALNSATSSGNFQGKMMIYIQKWHWFLISLVLCLVLVWVYLENATPIYKISSTLLILDDKKGDGILKSTAFSDLNMFQETKTVDNEIEIIRSKDLIFKVLKKLNLGTKYIAQAGFSSHELYGKENPLIVSVNRLEKTAYLKKLNLKVLSDSTFLLTEGQHSWVYAYNQNIHHLDYDFIVNKGPAFNHGPASIFIQFQDINKMVAAYSDGLLKVTPIIKESSTIILSLEDELPARGVDIINNIINTYNIENVQKKNIMAVNTILFIDKRLKSIEQDLSVAEGDIENYKQQNYAVDATAGEQINLLKSAEYNKMVEDSEVQLGIVNSIINYLSNTTNKFNVVPSMMGLREPILNNLITRFNDLQLERNRMLHSANQSNPLVQNLSDQITGLRGDIIENLNNIKKAFLIENDQLKKNSARYVSRIKSVPALERGLLQRNREQGVKTNLYQYLLQKREETALSLSATIPTSQMVDKPAYNPIPEYPKQPLLYLYGSILGFMLPAFLIYGENKLNQKVKDKTGVKQLNGLKILGELNHSKIKDPIVIQHGGKSTITELFRYIRMNLDTLDKDFKNKVMLVTSCIKGEGKTFFSINLGLTLAMFNNKVLIMEFDLRNPDLLKTIGMSQKKGIANFLEGTTQEVFNQIQPYKDSNNLYVLGCGSIPLNPAELLTSERVNQLFDLLKSRFDYIIVDTSPVGTVADAFSLAKNTDLSIYLVRYNYTSTEQLNVLRDIHENNKLKNLMVVFNDAKSENRPAYSYGKYGYHAHAQ